MKNFVKKEYLSLKMPSEDLPISDQQRILLALESLGYKYVYFPLSVIRKLYPLCRNVEFDITVTLVHREYDWVVANIESGDTTSSLYGLAVDYGSTTIIMQLVDLITGNTIFEEKEENGQIQYGTDILTRIVYTMENDNHVKDLHKATIDTLHKIMDRLTAKSGIDILQLPLMILSGNTTMIHFLLELNAWTVFASPYAPVTTNPGFLWGNELGMDFQGLIYTIPAASNYVGGDIVSGLLKLDIHKKEEVNRIISNLYADKIYEIQEIKSPNDYELNSDIIRYRNKRGTWIYSMSCNADYVVGGRKYSTAKIYPRGNISSNFEMLIKWNYQSLLDETMVPVYCNSKDPSDSFIFYVCKVVWISILISCLLIVFSLVLICKFLVKIFALLQNNVKMGGEQ